MKHLRGFNEELEPQTYRNAANSLRYNNKQKISGDLDDYADEKEFGFYNMHFATGGGVICKDSKFTDPTIVDVYYGEYSKKYSADDLVTMWREGGSLSIKFEFGFRASSATKKLHGTLNNPYGYYKKSSNSGLGSRVPMFSIELFLSGSGDGIDGYNYEYGSSVEDVYDFYNKTKSEEFYIRRPNDAQYFGLFSDKKSAMKFKKLLPSMVDKVKDKILDLLVILGGEAEDIERIMNSFKEIRVSTLYDNELVNSRSNNDLLNFFDKEMN